jgi:hypothetical protein
MTTAMSAIAGRCTAPMMMMMMRRGRCVLSLLLFLLLLSGSSSATAAEKECIEIKSKSELVTQVETSNVLLVLLKKDDPLEDKDYKELCERFQATPVERVKELVIAKLTNPNLGQKLKSRATPTRRRAETRLFDKMKHLVFRKKITDNDDDVSVPEYLLIRKGNLSLDKPLHFVGESKTADTVSDFVSQQLSMKKIGSFVYSIGTLDFIAANLIHAEQNGSWHAKFWAYMSKIVRLLQQYPVGGDLSRAPTIHGKSLSDYYVKICFKVLEQGVKYPSKQVQRLERMLQQDGDQIAPLQKEEMQQKIYILKKFTEPMEIRKEEVHKFLLATAMNGMLLAAILVLLPMLLLSDNTNHESSKQEKEKTSSDDNKQETNDNDEKKQENDDEK